MARKQVLVQLNDRLVQRLDTEALRSERSRSSLIRDAIENYLKPEWDEEVARQYREGYERQPQTEDEIEWSDSAARELLGDLESEEGDDGW